MRVISQQNEYMVCPHCDTHTLLLWEPIITITASMAALLSGRSETDFFGAICSNCRAISVWQKVFSNVKNREEFVMVFPLESDNTLPNEPLDVSRDDMFGRETRDRE